MNESDTQGESPYPSVPTRVWQEFGRIAVMLLMHDREDFVQRALVTAWIDGRCAGAHSSCREDQGRLIQESLSITEEETAA